MDYEKQTQQFSTFGDKLLQHTDVLHGIQSDRVFRPITVQLSPTEACDSHCSFCSVANRPRGITPFATIVQGLTDFRSLGAKSVEVTGGGNPLLYRDGDRTVNDILSVAHGLGYKTGVITNSERPSKHLNLDDRISWIRVSLAKLDEGKSPGDYDFSGFDAKKVGLSYIINSATTPETISRIAEVVDRNPDIKFVRIAPDCLTEASLTLKRDWGEIIDEMNRHGRFFVKEINDNFHPYPGGCWVGMVRPYWTTCGIYICTSHVLISRTYDDRWRLCGAEEIIPAWSRMNERFRSGMSPYDIDIGKCWHCYYYNNNRLLDAVISDLPDKDFA